jgi:hypothetical protein
VASVTVTLSLEQRRLLLALLEHAANQHAEAVQEQAWDWLSDLFASSWETLEGARAALETASTN